MTKEELQALLSDETTKGLFQEIINGEIETQTAGLKAKTQELLNEKKSLQEKLGTMPTAEELELFNKMKVQIASSEEARLISEGKMDDVIRKRTELQVADFTAKLTEATTKLTEVNREKDEFQNKYINKVIGDDIRQAAISAGILPQAVDDVIRRASGVFSLEADGSVVSRDSNGIIKTLNDKVLTPKVFVESLKEQAPYYWPQSKGANLAGFGNTEETLINAANKGDVQSYIKARRDQKK